MVRYYGYYSNKSRGVRKKDEHIDTTESQSPDSAETITAIVESDLARKKFRKNRARLIQKIYFVAPLLCPKCGGSMRIISFIEDDVTIKKTLMHLDLWAGRRQSLLLAHATWHPQTHDPPQVEPDYITISI